MEVYLYNDGEMQPFAGPVDLAECFPDKDDPEMGIARWTIERCGYYLAGGGAAPAILIKCKS